MSISLPVTITLPPVVTSGQVITSAHMNQVRQAEADLWTNVQALGAGAAPQTPWAQDVNAAGFRLLGAGNIGIGTSTPGIAATAGRAYMTIRGASSCGTVELTSGAADSDGSPIGIFQATDANIAGAEKRIASILMITDGATANNRGGSIRCNVRPDGGTALVEAMRITPAGRVGININAPAGQVHAVSATVNVPALLGQITAASGANYAIQAIAATAAAANTGLFVNVSGATSENYGIRIVTTPVGGNNYAIYADAPAKSYFAGFVGIGIPGPTAPLHVAAAAGFAGNVAVITGAGTGTFDCSVAILNTNAGATVAAGIVRISANNNSASNALLSCVTPTQTAFTLLADGMFSFAPSSNSPYMMSTAGGLVLMGYTGSNGAYRLQVNSQIFATSGTIATSDGRYKTNVEPVAGALDIVARLRPVAFDWLDHPVHEFDCNHRAVGFVAQDLQAALAGTEYQDALVKRNLCRYRNGAGADVEEEFFGTAETGLIPILTRALQELAEKVARLEGRAG